MRQPLDHRVKLAELPTPVQPMDRLGQHLGLAPGALWVKRDDLTGLAGGGNKTRKLEYLCADALSQGADTLVTGAGIQSNHCRQTAAAAAKLGLKCSLVLAGPRPGEASGNVLLDLILGADIVWQEGDLFGGGVDAAIERRAAELAGSGAKTYSIPVGGSNAVGALGYVRAANEIREQLPDAHLVVFGTGSCGTHAGLAAGYGDHSKVLGIRIGEREDMEGLITEKAAETAVLAGLEKPVGECQVEHGYLGAGYGQINDATIEAIELAGRLEGLICDPVYSGKALSGLIGCVRSGRIPRDQKTVFLHTGGLPGLFSDRFKSVWPIS